MTATLRSTDERPDEATRPPAVLTAIARPTRPAGGLRPGYGLDWLLIRADGKAADRTAGAAAQAPRR